MKISSALRLKFNLSYGVNFSKESSGLQSIEIFKNVQMVESIFKYKSLQR